MTDIVPATDALARLLAGNSRFVDGTSDLDRSAARRSALVDGQFPIATVLGCVDSRVPPELVFDQGLGDLLTVRSAGQTLTGVTLGSVAFGVRSLGIPLVVVLGHTGCGAVAAYLSENRPDGHLGALVQEVADRLSGESGDDPDAASAANIAATVEALRGVDSLRLPDGSAPSVVGLLYELATGRVKVQDDAGLGVS